MARHNALNNYIDHHQYQRSPEGRLEEAVGNGNCNVVREILDDAFWHDGDLRPDWEHLKMALRRDDQRMLRLLITWGARAPQSNDELQGIAPEKFATYARILRRYGLDATVVEKAAASVLKPEIGQMTVGEGIYLGKWAPTDDDGKSLGKIFNVYAAPQDIPFKMTYPETVEYFSKKLKNWNGFSGAGYRNSEEIFAALRNGSYKCEWIIPPVELLTGFDGAGNGDVQKNSLYKYQNTRELKDTFAKAISDRGLMPFTLYGSYWSSSSRHCGEREAKYVDFSSGSISCAYEWQYEMNCRPVRLVEVSDAKQAAADKPVKPGRPVANCITIYNM